MPSLLLRRNAGLPVVVLAALFQHSPLVIISLEKAKISSPHDLVGRQVMLGTASNGALLAMIVNEGVALNQIKRVEHSFKLEDLLQDKVDAASMYVTDRSYFQKQLGVTFTILSPINYGIDFYGDCLFTSEQELRNHPKRVRAFREASLRGWNYAMDHPEEIAQLIHKKYAPQKSVAWLIAEFKAMEPLFLHHVVEIGHMNPGRWQHIGDTYAKLGMLPTNYSLDGFLHNPGRSPQPAR